MSIQEINTTDLLPFTSISIWPCVYVNGTDVERIVGLDEHAPGFYSVYANQGNGEDQWLMDVDDKDDAQAMYAFLSTLLARHQK